MPELLIEIFSEEIPARMQLRAAEDFKSLAEKYLADAGFADLQLTSYVTPRRLVLTGDLPSQQPDRSEEIKGPRVHAPQQALAGFMQANGLKSLDGIEQRDLGKAKHYFITREEKGRATTEILPGVLEAIIQNFPWPKSMKWGLGTQTWVRPLHNVNVIFDGKVIVGSGEFYGHRFLSQQPFKVNNFAEYQLSLMASHVILDQTKRRDSIQMQAQKLAAKQELNLKSDDALLDEVTGLVEWPVAMLGTFEKEYLAVPQECLIATMRANQKYFPLFDTAGKLANHFIVIANVPGSAGQEPIVHGNERVLRARLSDAKFFYEQDLKSKLDSRIEKLKTIQFHEKLGTLYDKTARITLIAEKLASALKADKKQAARAAQLCKADLFTGMVGEFPELQGIMGRYYALADGEDGAVADAIRDHYQPLGPTAAVPSAPISIVLAIADKLDTLSEFFRINEKPTGSKDPYALRRAALGIIRIILENKIHLPLAQFLAADVLEFIKDRLQVTLRDEGLTAGQVKACVNVSDDIYIVAQRARALAALLAQPVGKSLQATYTRAANILRAEEKKDGHTYNGAVQTALLQDDAEKKLVAALTVTDATTKVQNILETQAATIVQDLLKAHDNTRAAETLADLQPALDAFFRDVMVNAEIIEIRANRLNLLGQIRSVFHQFADFSQLEG
jgi:glycyl-tRNA synthetase beta chain